MTQVQTALSSRRYDDPRRWWMLAACCTVAFAQQAEPFLWMIGYEIPSSAFGTGWREYRVLASLGALLFVACQLVGGVLGDLLGRRLILLLTALVRPNTPYLVLVPMMMLFGLGFLIASASWAYFFFAALPADLIGLNSGLNRAAGLAGSGLAGVLLPTVVALRGTADFKLRMGELSLNPQQQAIALQAVDVALRQGITVDDLARTPATIGGLGLMAAYREAFGVGVASALVLTGAVCLAVALVAWLWLRGIKGSADDAGAGGRSS